jgi:tetratricopeptide (TPR) repeat protein
VCPGDYIFSRWGSSFQAPSTDEGFPGGQDNTAQPPLLGDPAFEARLAALKAASAAAQATRVEDQLASVLDASPMSVLDTPVTSPESSAASADGDIGGGGGGNSTLVRIGALISVVVLVVVFGLSDVIFSTTSGTSSGPISAATKAKLAQLVDGQDVSSPDKALALARAATQLERHVEAATAYSAALNSLPSGDPLTFTALTGLVDADISAGQPRDAVSALTSFEKEHAAELASGASFGGLDATEVTLLRAKAVAAAGDVDAALAALDKLIDSRPEDFRPLLAKGLQLRNAGKDLAAERVLLKARYLAPKEARKLVDNLIGER